jgi:hypothetical protein
VTLLEIIHGQIHLMMVSSSDPILFFDKEIFIESICIYSTISTYHKNFPNIDTFEFDYSFDQTTNIFPERSRVRLDGKGN